MGSRLMDMQPLIRVKNNPNNNDEGKAGTKRCLFRIIKVKTNQTIRPKVADIPEIRPKLENAK